VRDVRVVQRRKRLRLAREACDAIAIGGKSVRKDLDGDVAIQPGVSRPVHFAHTAGAERGL
jgi:hypothetical protein